MVAASHAGHGGGGEEGLGGGGTQVATRAVNQPSRSLTIPGEGPIGLLSCSQLFYN